MLQRVMRLTTSWTCGVESTDEYSKCRFSVLYHTGIVYSSSLSISLSQPTGRAQPYTHATFQHITRRITLYSIVAFIISSLFIALPN